MRKKNIVLVFNLVLTFLTLIATTYAWYTGFFGVDPKDDGTISAKTGYYESGTGTSSDPYIISAPRHLYNLAWLQDLGFYDDKIYYFKLKNSIDMTSVGDIPPIGIDAHPFRGNFNGNGYVIYNVGINTKLNEFDVKPSTTAFMNENKLRTGVLNIPASSSAADITEELTSGHSLKTSYVGLFGIISQTTKNDGQGIHDFYIHKAKINNNFDSLSGLIAGYVDGNMSNIGVSSSYISFVQGMKGLSSYGTTLTGYSLIGDYNDESGASGGGVSWDDYTEISGDNDGWGGSVDIKTMIRRINYMQTKLGKDNNISYSSGKYSGNVPGNSNNGFNINIKTYGDLANEQMNWLYSGSTNVYADIMTNSYIPLNVNKATMGLDTDDETVLSDGRRINSYYNENTTESISSSNTGYVVGAKTTGTYTSRFRVQKLNVSPTVNYSMNSTTASGTKFDNNNLYILGLSANDTTPKIIRDDFNKGNISNGEKLKAMSSIDASAKDEADFDYHRYSDVRQQLSYLFENDKLYGVRLNTKTTDTGAYSKNKFNELAGIMTAHNITWNGKTYDDFEFVNSSVNFTLKNDGYAAVVMGCYIGGSTNYETFSFYKVERDENGVIKDTIKCVKDKMNLGSRYVGTIVYQEVYLEAGDYILGCETTSTPYLLYLDIGANAQSSGGSGSGSGGSQFKSSIDGIDFVHISTPEEAQNIFTDSYTFSQIVIKAEGEPSVRVYIYFKREDENTDTPVVKHTGSKNGVTVGSVTKKQGTVDDDLTF